MMGPPRTGSGRKSLASRCGETVNRLPALVADECVDSSEGTRRPEYPLQRPLDSASRVQASAKSLDREFEKARGTHDLAAVVDTEKLADVTPNDILGRVPHLALWP